MYYISIKMQDQHTSETLKNKIILKEIINKEKYTCDLCSIQKENKEFPLMRKTICKKCMNVMKRLKKCRCC